LILADTTIWIDYFRSGDKELRRLLNEGQIAIHTVIIGELALGSLRDRHNTLALLDRLPHVQVAQMSEVRRMIEARRLFNMGIGLTDALLIASILLAPTTYLWTRVKALRKAAERLHIHANLG
jgi:predicted nucleic acid-binding protein